jgi:site-specific DNA recombinase
MDPELFRVFAAGFVEEWNRIQRETAGDQIGMRSELDRARRQIDRLVDAIADGTPMAAVRDRLAGLETRRLELEGKLATAVEPAPRLHPNLAYLYRERVRELSAALAAEDAAEARELVRGLVETITLVPENGSLRIEVRGELGAILRMADAGHNKGAGISAGALIEQVKLVAGIGFEPMTFRL